MTVETLNDVLSWTRKFHQQLASCMHQCADKNASERARLLLDYLAEHEQKLVELLDGFKKTADTSALDTWFYEYLDKHPFVHHEKCDKPFEQMNVDEIFTEIAHQHEQVIDLYRYLRNCDAAASYQELLDQLLSLEEHEAMRMSQSANRLHDL